MDTKTRKEEALELLALDSPSKQKVARLEVLTCLQTGNDEDCWRDFCTSVDACLLLKLPDRCIWKLYHGDDRGASATVLFRPAGQPALDWGFGRAKTLPLAMLTAWWSMQD